MFHSFSTLDDLLMGVYPEIKRAGRLIHPSKGDAYELTGVLLEIKNPLGRLSRTEKRSTLFSCFGELLWYLTKRHDLQFIEYYIKHYTHYSDDGVTIYGGYGPRLFDLNGIDQVQSVINCLLEKQDSRQAVIQIFGAGDITKKRKDVPCTCTLQFLLRDGRLDMLTSMRSNDAFMGLPHDVFAFTMLQEIIARTIGVELGSYKHVVGSLHLYLKNEQDVDQYIDEGWQENIAMPPMPIGDPWGSVRTLLDAESDIRSGKELDASSLGLQPYWEDLVRLLQIWRGYKDKRRDYIHKLMEEMHSDIYDTYIKKKQYCIVPHRISAASSTVGGE